MQTQVRPEVEPSKVLMQLISGYGIAQAIYVAAKLGVADLLANGPQSADAMCQKLGAHQDNFYRVLRALDSLGMVKEKEHQVFELTPMGELLQTSHPRSMRAIAMMMGEEHYTAWGRLKDAVMTGIMPFEAVYGMGFFDYVEKHPETSATFNSAMTALVKNDHAAVVDVYDFGQFNTLVDIGGGKGTLLSLILQRYATLKGILFDLPHVLKEAEAPLAEAGLTDRIAIEGGDFFKAVVPGGDAYVMSHIIHDWRDELAATILSNIAKVLPENGKVLVVEYVLGPDSLPMAKFMDLNMMVMTPGGRERTREEFEALFAQSGLKLNTITPTPSGIAVIEAIKA